jgi:glycine/D-amino acid oxidase-like deaminating enzyme
VEVPKAPLTAQTKESEAVKLNVDVVVIGGGAIGTAITYYLAKTGVKVALLERRDICNGTSGACDQAVSMQTKNPGLVLEMAMKSVQMYRNLADELDYDLEFEQCGGMIPIENEKQLSIMNPFVEQQKSIGLDVCILDIAAARIIQPALGPNLVAATFSPMDGRVSPLRVAFGFARAAARRGAIIKTRAEVSGIEVQNGKVRSVATSQGSINTGLVVDAGGVWAPQVGALAGVKIPIIPRRGQLLVTEVFPGYIRGEIWSARYIVAKHHIEWIRREDPVGAELGVGLSVSETAAGNLLIGGTREFVGYDTRTTPEALQAIVRHLLNIFPGFKDLHIIRSFAGLRPYTPDGMPILGPVEGIEGFVIAAGHEGDGVALAPVTGLTIADFIANGVISPAISEFGLQRFDQTTAKVASG